jgi:hypothetical protein
MSEFSYRPLLEEVTETAKSQGLDPYEAYAWLREHASGLGLRAETYASTSITSGGHARDNSLEMRDIISRNTISAQLLAEQLAADKQIEPASTIEPVFVGKTGWTQAEYMEFWLAVMAGAQVTKGFTARDTDILRHEQRTAFEAAEIDFELMNGHAGAEARATEYFKLASASAETYLNGHVHTRPVRRVVRMIDTDLSLGAQAERAFARQLAIPVMNICIVKPAAPSDLEYINHQLARDTQRLIQFGATVFDTANKQTRLLLLESA